MILLGTSGWSYDDWKGRWYPPGIARAAMLDCYASVFDAVEINATYYRVPGRKSAEGMVRAAAGRLRFAVKAPGDLTHKLRIDETTTLAWRRFLEPFADSGTLGAVLLQFPQRFHFTAEGAGYLRSVFAAIGELPAVVELRHESWDAKSANELLGELNASRALVDQPGLRGLSKSGAANAVGPIGYVRLHGRNAAAWHAGGEGSARYAYRYGASELQEWVPAIRELDAERTSTFVFFNNHPEGGAPDNAETMAGLLGQTLRGTGYRDLFPM